MHDDGWKLMKRKRNDGVSQRMENIAIHQEISDLAAKRCETNQKRSTPKREMAPEMIIPHSLQNKNWMISIWIMVLDPGWVILTGRTCFAREK